MLEKKSRSRTALTRSPMTPVVIEGDKGVAYEKITEVMNALYTAKIKRVGLAVKPAN